MHPNSLSLDRVLQLPLDDRVPALAALARSVYEDNGSEEPVDDAESLVERCVASLVHVIGCEDGAANARLLAGEVLGLMGDPRLRRPEDPDYWVTVVLGERALQIGRFPVTNSEYRAYVEAGGYEGEHWSEEAMAWRDGADGDWNQISKSVLQAEHCISNQPVVGVTWYEAGAYAAHHGARLPSFSERMGVVRGPNKRPYPWGEPFGRGNANTKEEGLGRPCAVGLFLGDRTPEGVYDLAGNVAEWGVDLVDEKRLVAPGAFSQESLCSWAKARALHPPDGRGADLGFRLVRDAVGTDGGA